MKCHIRLIFFLISYITLTSNFLFPQLVQQEWVARYPGPSNDLYGPFLAVDKDGNSYIAGTHVSDSVRILCVKYNTSGVQQWATLYKYPIEGYFVPRGLAIDSSGNAYVISERGPSDNFPTQGLITKFNVLNGTVVWAKRQVGEYGWSSFSDIKIDRLNNIYVAGWSDTSHLVIRYNTNGDSVWVRKYHPPSYPPFSSILEFSRACTLDDSLNIIFTGMRIAHYAPFNDDYDSLLVAKYSSGGVLRWESVYAYIYHTANVGTKITADQNGNLYIGGETVSSNGAVYLTLKYDRNGTRQWTALYDQPGSWGNTLRSVAMDRLNNAILVTGYSQLSGTTTFGVTIKYDASNGDSIWVIKYGMTNYISGFNGIVLDSSGNSYVTGGSGPYNSSGDVLTIKYSPQGNQIWLITYNGPFNGGDGANALRLDNLNNVYVMGVSQSSSQIFDYIVINYSQLVGIQPLSNLLPNVFKLEQNYPNPFNPSTIINFQLPIKCFAKIEIYDVLGRQVSLLVNEELKAGTYRVIWDAGIYSSGVYFYKITAGTYIMTKKMILLR